jgi:TatD DNase family protein
VVERAVRSGIERILAVGTDLKSSMAAVALAREYGCVYAAVGVHPHRARQFEIEAEQVKALLGEPKVVAVGEIGLDYFRDRASCADQRKAFSTQLGWARERNLPACIHTRSAEDEVVAALQKEQPAAVLHCFSSDAEFAERALSLGCMLSFAGNLTFPKAEALRGVAAGLPEDRILVETDAPLLAPQPWRGRRNEPAYVSAVAETLAAVRHCSIPRLAASIRQNAERAFHWGTE